MKRGDRALVFLASAGMELCYLYACATFVTSAIFQRTFPFPEAIASFLAAALLTLFSEGRGWRVIYILAFLGLGFVPALMRMIQIFASWSESFLAQTWFTDFFTSSGNIVEYSVFVLVVGWALVFWAGGIDFAKRPRDYSTLCSHFDRGLIAFFILFLTRFYLQAAQGIRVSESISGFFVFPFLIFSLLAIGLVRNQGAAHRDFLPGYQALGVMLGFIVIVLLAGSGLVFFFLPYLTLVAEKGNDALGVVFQPLVSVFLAILVWLFGTDFTSNTLPATNEIAPTVSAQWSFPWWVELVGRVLAWGVALIVALVMFAILVGLLYSIFKWLFSTTPIAQEKKGLRNFFYSLLASARALILFFWRGLAQNVKGYEKAAQLYAALRTWGRHSGLPNFPAETPTEYGARLRHRFPELAREFETIVQVFNREVYGEITLADPQLAPARSAWRELARPAHLFLRLKAWFRRPVPISETTR